MHAPLPFAVYRNVKHSACAVTSIRPNSRSLTNSVVHGIYDRTFQLFATTLRSKIAQLAVL